MYVFIFILLFFTSYSTFSFAQKQNPYSECFIVGQSGKSLVINGDVTTYDPEKGVKKSLCRDSLGVIAKLIESDKFASITIKGDDSYLGSLLIELAGIVPKLTKLKTLNLDAYYPHDYLDNDVRDFSEMYKDNHGLIINFVYDGSIILKQVKIK